jgi:hypothetical protein
VILTIRGCRKKKGHHAACMTRFPRNSVSRRGLSTKIKLLAGSMNFLMTQLSISSHTRTASFRKTSWRRYVKYKKIPLSKEAKEEVKKWKQAEEANKGKGNVSIEIRRGPSDSSYLSMDHLANLVDKSKDPLKEAALSRDAREYKPIRDAVAHTALLTDSAKKKLTSVRENIRGRVKTILR